MLKFIETIRDVAHYATYRESSTRKPTAGDVRVQVFRGNHSFHVLGHVTKGGEIAATMISDEWPPSAEAVSAHLPDPATWPQAEDGLGHSTWVLSATDQRAADAISLAQIETSYREAAEEAESLRIERNQLVRAALSAGWTHAELADATGLTRGRIGQLATGH